MSNNDFSAMYSMLGVIIGALLTFLTQYFIHKRQEESEMRKQAINLKNEQCLALWKVLSGAYQDMFFTGFYSMDKIDFNELRKHVKAINMAVINAEPFISHKSFMGFIGVRDAINDLFIELETEDSISYKKYMDFIQRVDKLMTKARDILREELQLENLIISS